MSRACHTIAAPWRDRAIRDLFAVAISAALVGIAGGAHASATIDLVWIDVSNVDSNGSAICLLPANRDCPQLGTSLTSVTVSDVITLGVIVTAGPEGLVGAGVSVDYSRLLPRFSVSGFQRFTTTTPGGWLTNSLGVISDIPPYIDNFSALALLPGAYGVGLPAGNTAYLGTITFHKDQAGDVKSEIAVGTFGPSGTDAVGDGNSRNISSITTFNSAFVPEPGALPALASGIALLALLRGSRSAR